MPASLLNILIYAGIVLFALVVIGIILLDARGLHGDGGEAAGGSAGGQANLADAAVAAAMRYRVGGPLIDGLMAELGIGGGSLNAMLAGSDGQATPNTPAPRNGVLPSARANGSGEGSGVS